MTALLHTLLQIGLVVGQISTQMSGLSTEQKTVLSGIIATMQAGLAKKAHGVNEDGTPQTTAYVKEK